MGRGYVLLTVHSTAVRFSLNPIADLRALLHYQFMQHAFEAGTVVAIVAGVIGYFVVLRGLSFAGHALSHIGFAGATGAVVIGVSPLFGLLGFTVVAAGVMGALGTRVQERDATVGIVMAWTLGLGVLFLNLYTGYATEAYALLFGEILGISIRDVEITTVAGALTLAALVVMYRPLLFASVDADVAEARGVPVGTLSILFLVVLAVAVSEGIGTGIILNGQLVRGPFGLAGEFGHVALTKDGPTCACGNRGCWEIYASNWAALRYYAEASSSLDNRRHGIRPARFVTAFEDVLREAELGDLAAIAALEQMARYLGRGMALLVSGLAPDVIVVVGEVTRAWDRVGPIIIETIRRLSFSHATTRIIASGPAPLPQLRGIIALMLQKRFGAPSIA